VRSNSRVCACTPSTAEITRTAPSRTQEPVPLGDEVRGPGVDQVDRDAVDDERHDGGLDGDAALAFSARKSVCVLPSSTLPISSMTRRCREAAR
jgi:hypothetical protein